MHHLLKRQLKKIGLSEKQQPETERFFALLELVEQAYVDSDENRYTLQRSLEISNEEMQTLYHRLEMRSQQRINAITTALPDTILLIDEKGFYRDVISSGAGNDLYVSREKLLGKTVHDIFSEDLSDDFLGAVKKAIDNNRLEVMEYSMVIHDEHKVFEARIMPTGFEEDGMLTVIAVIRNITIKKSAEDSMRLISKVFEEATEGILIENSERYVISVNTAFLRMFGLTEEETIGQHSTYFSRFLEEKTVEHIYEYMETEGRWQGEILLKRPDAEDLPVWMSIDAVYDSHEVPVNFVIMLTDISEIRRTREKLEFAATHDALTRLPNRVLLHEHLESAVLRAQRQGSFGAVLFIDLDDFKEINDNLGHTYGDDLLVQCAQRLKHTIRAEDTVGRLGGDEFLIIVENLTDRENSSIVAQSVLQHFMEPFLLNHAQYNISVSVGVSIFPDDGTDAETLIGAADIAMYHAKKSGKDNFKLTSATLKKESNTNFSIDQAIKRADKEDDFFVRYQPQIDLLSGKVISVEALVRIYTQEEGVLQPESFISIAEQNGSIIKIGKWVIEHVCRQIRRWKAQKIFNFNVAINLSARQLNDDSLITFIKRISQKYNISSGELEFEVRENTLSHSGETAMENMKQLYRLGYKLVIDDFGSGQASLANLKLFALDKLKIDRHFIKEMLNNEEDQAIIEATIALGKSFGLKVIAEGVENEAQKEFLHQHGCDEMQGFLLSKPINADEISALVKERNFSKS